MFYISYKQKVRCHRAYIQTSSQTFDIFLSWFQSLLFYFTASLLAVSDGGFTRLQHDWQSLTVREWYLICNLNQLSLFWLHKNWIHNTIFKSSLTLLSQRDDNYNSNSSLLISTTLRGNCRGQLIPAALWTVVSTPSCGCLPVAPPSDQSAPAASFPPLLSLPVSLSVFWLPLYKDCSVLPAQHSD